MSKWINSLHQENSRIRDEIKKLKGSLRDVNCRIRSRSPGNSEGGSKTPILTLADRQNISTSVKKQLENGIFIPAKLPSRKESVSKNSAKALECYLENAISSKIKKLGKNIDKTTENLQKPKVFHDSSNIASNRVLENFKKLKKKKLEEAGKQKTKPRTLKDSFESYYESEEENIEKFGKCELSYVKYREEHEAGTRRKERKMHEEIENLRNENSLLKGKIKELCKEKAKFVNGPKGKSARGRTCSRTSQRSEKMRRSCASLSVLRRKYCKKCDALLSKGFSTSHCVKHGNRKLLNNP